MIHFKHLSELNIKTAVDEPYELSSFLYSSNSCRIENISVHIDQEIPHEIKELLRKPQSVDPEAVGRTAASFGCWRN